MSRVETISVERNTAPAADGYGSTVWAIVRRVARLAMGARVLGVVACGVLLLWVILVSDALWPMSEDTRGGLGLLWAGLTLAGLVWAFWPRRRGENDALAGAARMEAEAGLVGQPLVTAMTVPMPGGADDPLARALRERAIARADTAAAEATPRRVAPMSLLLAPMSWLWLALIPWLIIAVVFPPLPGIGAARFVQAGADVPPFSLTTFKLGWSPEPVVVGGDVRIVATPEGVWPDDATLVLLDADHRPIERRAMANAGESYTLNLHALREPMTFHIEAHGRRTQRYTITPDTPPPPDGTFPGDNTDPDAPSPGDNGHLQPTDPATGEGAPDNGENDPAVSNLLDRLGGMAADLAELAAEAEQAAQDGSVSPEALAEQIEALLEEAGALADAMDTAGSAVDPETSPELADALGDLAEALRGLAIDGLPTAPAPDGEAGDPGPAQSWAEQAAQAARNDAARLAQGQGAGEAAIRSGLAQRNGGDDPGPFRDPEASGGYDELLGSGEDGVLPDALMQQVPPRYRDQTAAYFRRLAEDRDTPEDSP